MAAREQLERLTAEHADELARLQSSLRAEVSSRQQAEQVGAELSATQVRLEHALVQENERRLAAEQQVSQLTQARGRLEQELEQRGQSEALIKRELEWSQAQMREHGEALASERQRLDLTTGQLRAVETRLSRLQEQHITLATELSEARRTQTALQHKLNK